MKTPSSRETARILMARSDMSVRRAHHEDLIKRMRRMVSYIPPEYRLGFENAIEFLEAELRNELNWRTP